MKGTGRTKLRAGSSRVAKLMGRGSRILRRLESRPVRRRLCLYIVGFLIVTALIVMIFPSNKNPNLNGRWQMVRILNGPWKPEIHSVQSVHGGKTNTTTLLVFGPIGILCK